MDKYSTVDLLLFRIGMIEDILDHMVLPTANVAVEEESKDVVIVMDWGKEDKKGEEFNWEESPEHNLFRRRRSGLATSLSFSGDAFLNTGANAPTVSQLVLGGQSGVDSETLISHLLNDEPPPTGPAEESPMKSATRQTPSPKNEVQNDDDAAISPANINPPISTSENPLQSSPVGESLLQKDAGNKLPPLPPSPAGESLENLDSIVDSIDLGLRIGVQK